MFRAKLSSLFWVFLFKKRDNTNIWATHPKSLGYRRKQKPWSEPTYSKGKGKHTLSYFWACFYSRHQSIRIAGCCCGVCGAGEVLNFKADPYGCSKAAEKQSFVGFEKSGLRIEGSHCNCSRPYQLVRAQTHIIHSLSHSNSAFQPYGKEQ